MINKQTEYSDPINRESALKQEVSEFHLNHPKNYFGVPLAVAADGDTGFIIQENLVNMGGKARAGAEALGLINRTNDLTELGKTIVGWVEDESSVEEELMAFNGLKGSTKRFVDVADPYWIPIVQHALQQHTIAVDIVNILEKTGEVSLTELSLFAINHNQEVKNALLRNPEDYPNNTNSLSRDQLAELKEPEAYSGQAVYQFKTLLYHCGVLTERGKDTSALIPSQDKWAIDPMITEGGGGE